MSFINVRAAKKSEKGFNSIYPASTLISRYACQEMILKPMPAMMPLRQVRRIWIGVKSI